MVSFARRLAGSMKTGMKRSSAAFTRTIRRNVKERKMAEFTEGQPAAGTEGQATTAPDGVKAKAGVKKAPATKRAAGAGNKGKAAPKAAAPKKATGRKGK
jgi:hypothetical protein